MRAVAILITAGITALTLSACFALPTRADTTMPSADDDRSIELSLSSNSDIDMCATVDGVKAWQAKQDWRAKPHRMPLYLQSDPGWGTKPYAGSNIAQAGCGLVSASMAYSWLTKIDLSPAELYDLVGDSCTTGGLNDMEKFAAFGARTYGISCSDRYYDPARAETDALSGKAVICSVTGTLGDNWYGGHIVVMWSPDGEAIWIRDPASQSNSSRSFGAGEISSVSWAYFYTYSKEEK